MDNRLTPEQKTEIVEDALKNYPLVTMPKDITADVMASLRKDVRPAFVTWNDFAILLVVAICIAMLFFSMQSLPPIILAKLRIQGILLYQDYLVHARWLAPTALFGFAAFLSALAAPYLRRDGNIN